MVDKSTVPDEVTGTSATDPSRPPVGDWLVVPSPPIERGWRWARIVARIPGDGPERYRVRWVGNDRDSVVTPPPGYRIESAARWPHAPSSAIGLWPDPAGPGRDAQETADDPT
ncbi:DUF1918 domain-containing protein [Pseudonocardia abyssalis]|uniref:DUF1918 domain-containing protein n=1 Tax=Pseudonocardia abyssalis TaxID=2792008 RepID=A0ABS6UP85_9PSEU|nr:DUF1918 domain-containing protein [Pseudonocardia abyssalis]MBW0115094.1 DUF1918 domain-containing protein [Pseudonocardia abyssalis]MBW0133766.1 DUF1918 domain-containing protein [Pseudonocardia abyssalis]